MTVPVELPEGLLPQLGMSPDEFSFEVRLMVAARLYERGLASTGRAAELVGVPRTVLLSRLDSFGVNLTDLSPDELREDMENAVRGGH
jgi:predicted HTH domain antitoxin